MSDGHARQHADHNRPSKTPQSAPRVSIEGTRPLAETVGADHGLLPPAFRPGRGVGGLQTRHMLQLQRVHGNRHTVSALLRTHTLIQRAPPTPHELRLQLTDPDAIEGFDQWRQLVGDDNFVKMVTGAGGKDANAYDFSAASTFFKNKKMTKENFKKRRSDNEKRYIGSADETMKRIDASCKETDGTNRPGAAGNPPASAGPGIGTRPVGVTSEGALVWETQYGQPWMTAEGHYKKIRDYTLGLKDAIQRLQSYKPFIDDAGKLNEIDLAIVAATARLNAMRPALDNWNQRAALYPAIWEPTGKPKAVPPVDNSGTPVPDYPKEPGPMTV